MKRITIFLLLNILSICSGFTIFGKKNNCPDPHDIHPCYCVASKKPVVICKNMTCQYDFMEVMKAAKKKPLVGVSLESISFRYIPENAFEGIPIQSISISDSSLLSLSDTDHAFKGLEGSLASFKVQRCVHANLWEWTLLENLNVLTNLQISESHLLEISEDFTKLSKLPITDISFGANHISYIPEKAFANFTSLKQLHLNRNSIRTFSRSMLPKPAQNLNTLGLSNNEIKELPSDMFTEMPNLRYLYLGSNPILILDADTYQPIWNQLQIVFVSDVLHCDCRLSWITKKKQQKRQLIHGICHSPAKLKGQKITQLKADELSC